MCLQGYFLVGSHFKSGSSLSKFRKPSLFVFFKNFGFIYLFMAMLGPRSCARAFSSCSKWGPLLIAVRGPLTISASLVAENRLQTRRLSNCGSRAQSLRGMWDLPRPGLEPVIPAPAGRLSTTAPPGKPRQVCFKQHFCLFLPMSGSLSMLVQFHLKAKHQILDCVMVVKGQASEEEDLSYHK